MFEVLHCGEDRDRWNEALLALPYELRDIHYTPEWGMAHHRRFECQACLGVVRFPDEGFLIMQPFLLRPISDGGTRRFDMTSAGYGGPLTSATVPSRQHAMEFWRAKSKWVREAGVVAEFGMVNPLFASAQWVNLPMAVFHTRIIQDREVCLMPLQGGGIGKRMRGTRRREIEKALGHLKVDATLTVDTIERFAEDYAAAMERKGATSRWRLPASYIEQLCLLDGAKLVRVHDSHQDLCWSLFVVSKDAAYYLLSASVGDPVDGAADLAIMAAAVTARDAGCTWLHLGGGVRPGADDGLFSYKRSFGGITRPVPIVQTIYDRDTFGRLALANAAPADSDFFPDYRWQEAA